MVNTLREVSQIATLLRELHSFPALTTGCSLVRSTELQAIYRTLHLLAPHRVFTIIDKFFKEELQTISVSVYRFIEW
jgi:hypothetical protein